MKQVNIYHAPSRFLPFKLWDLLALVLIFAIFSAVAWGTSQMSKPFHLGDSIYISLNPKNLPLYGLESVLRMLIAMFFSLLATFIFGSLAVKNKHAERILLPIIDILQSMPVLGFLSITVGGFIVLFNGSLFGPEAACIFVLFTAQTWNMLLGFYQALKNIPDDLQEAAAMFHLSAWQRFWRIEVPLAMPSLVWNMMMSMSASWVFLVASEAITVNNQNIQLPGIGSYIFYAIQQANMHATLYAIGAMLVVILLYDQLLFRPLVQWSEKFRFEQNPDDNQTRAWFTIILQKSYLNKLFGVVGARLKNIFFSFRLPRLAWLNNDVQLSAGFHLTLVSMWYILILVIIVISSYTLGKFIFSSLSLAEAWLTFKLGLATLLRVLSTVAISAIIWFPVGIWIGLRPQVARFIQPIIQFLAAFPANLLFPLLVLFILHFNLNPQIWLTLLMIAGSQWYILFNVIAGTRTLSKDLFYVTNNFSVSGWLWWKRFIIPGVFPYFVTGAITAAGAAWNLSIVAEIAQWGNRTISAYGLGAYITTYTHNGDFHRIALSIAVMCLFVLLFNRILWKPLYRIAEKRYGVSQ